MVQLRITFPALIGQPEWVGSAAVVPYGRKVGARMRLKHIAVGAMAVAGVAWFAMPGASSASTANSAIPRYQHIVEIMMENTSYSTIIGNTLAPNLNALASKYGLATNYFGVTHPSEPNYVANIGQLLRHPGRQPVLLHAGAREHGPELRGDDRRSHHHRAEPGRSAHRGPPDLEGLLPEPAAD